MRKHQAVRSSVCGSRAARNIENLSGSFKGIFQNATRNMVRFKIYFEVHRFTVVDAYEEEVGVICGKFAVFCEVARGFPFEVHPSAVEYLVGRFILRCSCIATHGSISVENERSSELGVPGGGGFGRELKEENNGLNTFVALVPRMRRTVTKAA